MHSEKWERRTTRFAQTSVTLFPFPTAHHRPGSHADLSNCSLRIALDERNCFAVFSNQFNNSPMLVMPPCCASSAMRSEQFCLFRLCIAGDVLLRSEKEGRLSERSELCVPPDCSDTAPGTPKGRCIAVAFFCLLFLGAETRKVSGCRAAPGNALSSEEIKTSATTTDRRQQHLIQPTTRPPTPPVSSASPVSNAPPYHRAACAQHAR